MVGSCSASNCKNRHTSRGAEERISFHSFPKNKILLQKWLLNIKRDNWIPTKSSQLCSHHFSPDSYETSGWSNKPKLKSDAVPTIFVFPKHLQKSEERICEAPNEGRNKDEIAIDHLLQTESVELIENSIETGNAVPKSKRPRLCYLGDLQKHIVEKPEAKSENILAYTHLVEKMLEKKNKQIKCLQQKNQRLNLRLANLQSLVSDLIEKNLTADQIS